MSAPERIWLSRGWANTFTDPDDFPGGEAYTLATPKALAAAPEVQRLIAEAVAREREACAKIADAPLAHRAGKHGLWRQRRAAIAETLRNRKETT